MKELIAGLEGQLRQDFVKRMTKTLKRRPSQAEVDEKISEMPGGALLPVEVNETLCCCAIGVAFAEKGLRRLVAIAGSFLSTPIAECWHETSSAPGPV